MKWIFSLAIILSISLLGKEIDFDALANTKAQKTSVSLGFKNAIVTNEKKIMKLQMKQVKPIYDGLKAVAEYACNESNMKKLCLARAEYGDTYCYGIKNEDTKNLCLGITKYKSNCYSIRNEDEKNLCLAMTYQYNTSCFGIKNKDKKNLCLGVTKNKSNCFSIR